MEESPFVSKVCERMEDSLEDNPGMLLEEVAVLGQKAKKHKKDRRKKGLHAGPSSQLS